MAGGIAAAAHHVQCTPAEIGVLRYLELKQWLIALAGLCVLEAKG